MGVKSIATYVICWLVHHHFTYDAELKRGDIATVRAAVKAAEEAVKAAIAPGACSSGEDSLPVVTRAPLQSVNEVYGTGESSGSELGKLLQPAASLLQVCTIAHYR